MPFVALIAAPGGAPGARLKVKAFAGRSVSEAMFVIASRKPSSITLLVMGSSVGGEFTSLTTTATRPVALRLGKPSSRTITVTRFDDGPLPSPVGQLRRRAAAFKIIPGGAPASDNARP